MVMVDSVVMSMGNLRLPVHSLAEATHHATSPGRHDPSRSLHCACSRGDAARARAGSFSQRGRKNDRPENWKGFDWPNHGLGQSFAENRHSESIKRWFVWKVRRATPCGRWSQRNVSVDNRQTIDASE